MTNQSNAAQAAEQAIKAAITLLDGDLDHENAETMRTLLSKLRAEGVQAGDERADLVFDCGKAAGRQEVKNEQQSPDFQAWIRQAYREPENTAYTIYNMEVAYQAGRAALASAPVAELETMEEIHRRERERAPWKLPKDPTLPDSAPVADESPMAKMADALREKARQEQQAYQDRRNQATEWGPMPEGTEADNPTSSAPVAGEYTSAMGEAAEAYLNSFPYAHKLPAQFRWADLWAAMSGAAPQASAQGQYPHDTAIYIKGESVIVYSEVLDSGEREALVEKVRTLLRSS